MRSGRPSGPTSHRPHAWADRGPTTAPPSTPSSSSSAPAVGGATSRPSTASTPRRRGGGSSAGRRRASGSGSGERSSPRSTARRSWRGPRRSWTGPSSRQKGGRLRGADAQGQRHEDHGGYRRERAPHRSARRERAEGRGEAGRGGAGDGVRRPAAGPSTDAAGAADVRPGLRQPSVPALSRPAGYPLRDPDEAAADGLEATARPPTGVRPGGVPPALEGGAGVRVAGELSASGGAVGA